MNYKAKRISMTLLVILCAFMLFLGAATIGVASADVTVDTNDIITIAETASVRLDYNDADGVDKTGIRFTVKVKKENLENLKTTGGYTNVTIGAAIIPTDYLSNAELDAEKTSYDYNGREVQVLHIALSNMTEKEVVEGGDTYTEQTYNAVVVDIPNLDYLTELSARGYVKLSNDTETKYIQTETVAKRNIGEVITSWYTETDEELMPTEEEKDILQKMIDEKVATSLASSLDEGYLADFSDKTYVGLARNIKDHTLPTIEYLEEGYQGKTNLLKVTMKTETQEDGPYAGFMLKLPKSVENSEIKVTFYLECAKSTGLCMLDSELEPLTSDGTALVDVTTKDTWVTQTVNCTSYDNFDAIVFRAYTGSVYDSEKQNEVYLYLSSIEIKETIETGGLADSLEGNELADFSSKEYEKLITSFNNYSAPTATWLEEGYLGETSSVLKVEVTTGTVVDGAPSSGFTLKLPKKAENGYVEFKMLIEIDESKSGGVYFCDGSDNRLTSDGTTMADFGKGTVGLGVWATQTVDYSTFESVEEINFRVYTGSSRNVRVYFALIEG